MKTFKKVTLLTALSSAFFFSCKKQIDIQNVVSPVTDLTKTSRPTVVNGRVAFANEKDFFTSMEAAGKKSYDEVKRWGQQFNINHLNNYLDDETNEEKNPVAYKDLYNFAFPAGYLFVLNDKGEIQVGNDIIVYRNGYKYYVPASSYSEGMDVTQVAKKIKVDVSVIDKSNNNARINFGDNSLDARWQREFYQQSYQGNGNRKYVHEIVSFTDYYSFYDPIGGISGYTYYTQLRLRIKLEWKGRRNWSPAGEMRNISYNLTRDIYLRNVIYPYTSSYANIPFVGNISNSVTQNSELWVALGDASGNTVTGGVYWEVDLGGTIYQYVLGDLASNAWSNTAFPLW